MGARSPKGKHIPGTTGWEGHALLRPALGASQTFPEAFGKTGRSRWALGEGRGPWEGRGGEGRGPQRCSTAEG